MTESCLDIIFDALISTPMPLAGHDALYLVDRINSEISTPMPLAGHDKNVCWLNSNFEISTPMPLAGHDKNAQGIPVKWQNFYSHAPRGA